MKKILLALLIMIIVICCAACGNDVSASNNVEFTDRFDEIDWNTRLGIGLFVDTKTGVEYLISHHGGATVVVDNEDKPLIYDKALED